jgi:hypothetical protein
MSTMVGGILIMARNKFEQVDEVQEDAITLSLAKQGDRETGTVILPPSVRESQPAEDRTGDPLSAVDSFRRAIRLANEMKLAIVVLDPDGIWKTEWGDLYHEPEAAD